MLTQKTGWSLVSNDPRDESGQETDISSDESNESSSDSEAFQGNFSWWLSVGEPSKMRIFDDEK